VDANRLQVRHRRVTPLNSWSLPHAANVHARQPGHEQRECPVRWSERFGDLRLAARLVVRFSACSP